MMGSARLPQGYVETGGWGLKQAKPTDVLFAIVVGLSVPIALAHPGRPDCRARRLGCDHQRQRGDHWNRPRGRLSESWLHELVHGVLFLGVRRPPPLRVQAVDAARARLLRGRAGKLLHQDGVRGVRTWRRQCC